MMSNLRTDVAATAARRTKRKRLLAALLGATTAAAIATAVLIEMRADARAAEDPRGHDDRTRLVRSYRTTVFEAQGRGADARIADIIARNRATR